MKGQHPYAAARQGGPGSASSSKVGMTSKSPKATSPLAKGSVGSKGKFPYKAPSKAIPTVKKA